jgi:hypothetical protein
MPTFGASALGGTAPSGYIQESSKEETVEVATIKGPDGAVVVAQVKPRKTTVTVVKCKGDAGFVTVSGKGTFTAGITSAKVSQSNDDFSTSESTLTEFA